MTEIPPPTPDDLARARDAERDVCYAVAEAKRRVPDYPWSQNTAAEAVWALGESLLGVSAANDDLHAALDAAFKPPADDKLLDGYLGDAAALGELAPALGSIWRSAAAEGAATIRALVAEVRRLRRRNDDGTCRTCGRLPSSCNCGAAPVACHACGHDSIPCQCPE